LKPLGCLILVSGFCFGSKKIKINEEKRFQGVAR